MPATCTFADMLHSSLPLYAFMHLHSHLTEVQVVQVEKQMPASAADAYCHVPSAPITLYYHQSPVLRSTPMSAHPQQTPRKSLLALQSPSIDTSCTLFARMVSDEGQLMSCYWQIILWQGQGVSLL